MRVHNLQRTDRQAGQEQGYATRATKYIMYMCINQPLVERAPFPHTGENGIACSTPIYM